MINSSPHGRVTPHVDVPTYDLGILLYMACTLCLTMEVNYAKYGHCCVLMDKQHDKKQGLKLAK